MSNYPTLDGLNNIDADSGNLTNITCETFIATSSAQVPTMIAGSSDNNVATTEFVTDAITNAPYVTTDTTQTLTTGTKYFTNLPQCSTLATTANQFTNKQFVDNAVSGISGSYVTISGSQTLTTGIKSFTNLPQSSAVPSNNADLVNKLYVDNATTGSFVTLSGTQTITGNKTTTGNAIFYPTTGSTIIRGTQADIYPTITYLTSPTTTISGTILNANSTQNWFNGDYINLSGAIQTTMRSPTTLITSASCQYFTNQASIQTAFTSPSFLITNNCTSFDIRATNTYLDNSVVTATTQASSDNSSKLATTAFVNNHVSSNYMTLATNQSVSGVKTYSTKQIFNAGTASSTYDNVSLTDMTIASNSANGILSIAGGKITTDTFGVRAALQSNLQLNESTFIQPNTSLAIGKEPVFTFGVNQVANFSATTSIATATVQINTTAFKYWCGNNQSTLFSLTHSLTNGYVTGPSVWEELEIYISWIDANTGITRLTSGNLSTTGVFTMNPSATVIRPTITFTLDTSTLPEAVYNINAFIKIQNAYISNALNTMTWNLSATPSTFTTTQNYNTPKDYTFTSRNLYHCFRNTAMCGVFIINNIATQQNIMTPIHYSITDFTNFTTQPTTAGALTTPAYAGQTVAGNFVGLSINNADNIYLVYPNYSIILYDGTAWSSTVLINYKNTSSNPVCVAPTTTQRGSSCRIYFDEVELIKY